MGKKQLTTNLLLLADDQKYVFHFCVFCKKKKISLKKHKTFNGLKLKNMTTIFSQIIKTKSAKKDENKGNYIRERKSSSHKHLSIIELTN